MKKIVCVLFLSVMICSLAMAMKTERPVGPRPGNEKPVALVERYLDVSCFFYNEPQAVEGSAYVANNLGEKIPGQPYVATDSSPDGRLRFKLLTGKNYYIQVVESPTGPGVPMLGSAKVLNFNKNEVRIVNLER